MNRSVCRLASAAVALAVASHVSRGEIVVDCTPRPTPNPPPPPPDRPSRWPVESKISARLPHQGKREIARRLRKMRSDGLT